MKLPNTVIAILTMCVPLSAVAEDLVATLPIGGADDGVMRIDAVPGERIRHVTEIPNPGITSPVWAVKGMLRHDGVEGDAYLQLDNHFGDRGTFFTRSLAPSGPLGKLTGDSDWREFMLPFYANRGDQAEKTAPLPEALTLSVYLPGAGTVYLRDVALYQYADDEDPMAAAGSALSRTTALFGAIGGTLVGIWGSLIGFLASRGKARSFAIVSANLMILAGFACLAAGIFALTAGRPYAVWYPYMLFGVILLVVCGSLRKILPQRYAEHELKKMRSMDA